MVVLQPPKRRRSNTDQPTWLPDRHPSYSARLSFCWFRHSASSLYWCADPVYQLQFGRGGHSTTWLSTSSLQTTLAFRFHSFFGYGFASSSGYFSSPAGLRHGVRIPVWFPQYTITWSALPTTNIVELAVSHCIANTSFCTSLMLSPKFGLPMLLRCPLGVRLQRHHPWHEFVPH